MRKFPYFGHFGSWDAAATVGYFDGNIFFTFHDNDFNWWDRSVATLFKMSLG
jgi:hypothetical protein